MKLRFWMKARCLIDQDMADRAGVDRCTISRIRRGVNRPSWELAARIKAATLGAVTADDFLPAPTEAAE